MDFSKQQYAGSCQISQVGIVGGGALGTRVLGADPSTMPVETVQAFIGLLAAQAGELSERANAIANTICGPVPVATSGSNSPDSYSVHNALRLISQTLSQALCALERAQCAL